MRECQQLRVRCKRGKERERVCDFMGGGREVFNIRAVTRLIERIFLGNGTWGRRASEEPPNENFWTPVTSGASRHPSHFNFPDVSSRSNLPAHHHHPPQSTRDTSPIGLPQCSLGLSIAPWSAQSGRLSPHAAPPPPPSSSFSWVSPTCSSPGLLR